MKTRTLIVILSLVAAACMKASSEKAPAQFAANAEPPPPPPGAPPPKTAHAARVRASAVAAKKEAAKPAPMDGFADVGASGGAALGAPMAEEAEAKGEGGRAAPAPTRAWFPETFLWEPLVVTDDRGAATVKTRVPDRLTTWRILALAHSRDGALAGTETSFLGTLPTYVDPVLPSFVMAQDEVSIPVQVVNTTEESVTRTLHVEADGAGLAHLQGAVAVAAGASKVEYAPLHVNRPGIIHFKASLGDKDAIEKTIPALPSGKPVIIQKGGTLAQPRTIGVEIPDDMEPDSGTVRAVVYPGALALLRSELGQASMRGGVAEDAYALLLAGKGEALLRSLGGDVDPKALRNLAIVVGQRVIRAARSPDPATAAILTEAALAHTDNPVLGRLGERLADTVARSQRPDGTFQGADGWTLQRLLVTAADSVRAVMSAAESGPGKQRAERVRIAAEGAFERNIDRVTDAFSAASIVSSGALGGTLRDKLRARIREKLRKNEDGSRSLPIEEGVVRADGRTPSEVEGTALAVLALMGDPESSKLTPDLGARLLSTYSPASGWGDGETNLAALRAVLALFKDPLPPRIAVKLSIDGRVLSEGVLEGAKLRESLPLEGELPNKAGSHKLEVSADPPVPGLAFALTTKLYVPWPPPSQIHGLELSIETPKPMHSGRPAEIALSAQGPAGMLMSLRHALPAGTQPDRASLDALVSAGTIVSYTTEDGAVTMLIAPRQIGQSFEARYRVIPTLAGTLTSGASSLSAVGSDETFFLPPRKWLVK
jgi:hypothetical protein